MKDIIVCGTGAAGFSAAMYSARGGADVLVLGDIPGGQTLNAHAIENYPGVEMTDGFSLMETMRKQALSSGAEIKTQRITEIDFEKKEVNGIPCKAIILALGASHRKLGLPNEESLVGKGVSYCATCDGNFFRGKTVAVAGGGNTALTDALFLSKICKEVYLIHRRDTFRAEQTLIDKVLKTENIILFLNQNVKQIEEENGKLSGVVTEENALKCEGLFVAIGTVPNVSLLPQSMCNDKGVVVDTKMQTNIKGVFAAGDMTDTNQKQVVAAAGDGAKAAKSALTYIQSL